MPSCVTKSRIGSVAELVSGKEDGEEGERQHRAGRVVQRGLGDDRLRDLRPDPDPLEERDQDRRVGRCERGADQQTHRGGDVEDRRRDEPDQNGRDDHAGDDEHAEADGHPAEHPHRELQPAVEQDDRNAEREQDLRADRVEGNVDPVENRGPEEGSDPEQEQHPWQPQPIGERLHDEPRRQHDPERQDDVFGVHATGF